MKLQQLLELRKKIRDIEQQIESLMPEAIEEALTNISGKGNQIALDNKSGKIVVVLRKRFSTTKDDLLLAKLDTDIKAELSRISIANSQQLQQLDHSILAIQTQLATLKAEQENLLCSRYLIKLKKQFKDRQESTEELIPFLSVFLK